MIIIFKIRKERIFSREHEIIVFLFYFENKKNCNNLCRGHEIIAFFFYYEGCAVLDRIYIRTGVTYTFCAIYGPTELYSA